MTTTVTVKANHGWPVDVAAIEPETGDIIKNYGGRVPAGETRDFICTSSQDLLIHEVQPDEIAAEGGEAGQDAPSSDDSLEDAAG